MEAGNGVKGRQGVGWELARSRILPLCPGDRTWGFSRFRPPPSLHVRMGQLEPQVLPRLRKAVLASCLLYPRGAAARSRATQGPGLSRSLGGWGRGRGRDREGGGDEQIRTTPRSSWSPHDQESQLCLHVGQLDVTSHF